MRSRSRVDRAHDLRNRRGRIRRGRIHGDRVRNDRIGHDRPRDDRLRDERGSVTAEFAAVLPAVVLVLVAALGAMQLAGEQLRLQGAVSDAARVLGRGDSGAAQLVSRSVADATLRWSQRDDLVCAEVRAPAAFGILSAFTLRATACALDDAR